jgi:hypothetical protein
MLTAHSFDTIKQWWITPKFSKADIFPVPLKPAHLIKKLKASRLSILSTAL